LISCECVLPSRLILLEEEHMIFGLLGQANLTQNDVLQFRPFTSE
jgi:hypothetical protein